MLRTIQYSFPSKADGLEISCLAVVPELERNEKYRGIIQIVHGMSEYKERYIPFMEYMAERKYISVIHDHRGHGKSVRSKEDLGYMYGGGADAMLQDIHTVNCLIKDHFPGIPLILFGHSMGSLAVRAYAAHHDSCMDMLIVCGSPSYNVFRPVGVALAKAGKTVFGPKHSAGLIEMMSFGSYAMRFKKEKNRFSFNRFSSITRLACSCVAAPATIGHMPSKVVCRLDGSFTDQISWKNPVSSQKSRF